MSETFKKTAKDRGQTFAEKGELGSGGAQERVFLKKEGTIVHRGALREKTKSRQNRVYLKTDRPDLLSQSVRENNALQKGRVKVGQEGKESTILKKGRKKRATASS